jgi:hydroxymethylpyrimidine/phosphomethylpyrimidine kinase
MKTYKRVLSIAGSDCSGGAGIDADLKTISACGGYAMAAVTALVAENTVGVQAIHEVPADFVRAQIASCLDDIGADAIKIGMLGSPGLIEAVAASLDEKARGIPVVLDPVMVAQSGDRLVDDASAAALEQLLLPRATIVTPNLPEAEALAGMRIRTSGELPRAADAIAAKAGSGTAFLIKGGHLEDEPESDDFLRLGNGETLRLEGKRIATKNNHGTGCTLSSAIATFLAHGCGVADAVTKAKAYITEAIRAGAAYEIGHGHGPVHHFHAFWA